MTNVNAIFAAIGGRLSAEVTHDAALPADHPVRVLTTCISRLEALPARHASNQDENRAIIKELRQLCIEELPEYVQPVGYKIIPEMPLTLAAKFDYRKLEEEITPRDY